MSSGMHDNFDGSRVNVVSCDPRLMRKYPTHLTCPYCPAQAVPDKINEIQTWGGNHLMPYLCPSKHKFYAPPEKEGY